jgi:hypothetical protein
MFLMIVLLFCFLLAVCEWDLGWVILGVRLLVCFVGVIWGLVLVVRFWWVVGFNILVLVVILLVLVLPFSLPSFPPYFLHDDHLFSSS